MCVTVKNTDVAENLLYAGLCYLFSHNIQSPVQNKIHRFRNTSINLWVRHNLDKLFFYSGHKKGNLA